MLTLDYHLFGPLKEFLHGNHYASMDDVKRGMQTWIKQTPAAFFEKGIMNLMSRWQKCIASDGDCGKIITNQLMDFSDNF